MKINNEEMESAVIASLISDSNCQESREALDTISEDDFSTMKNKYLFRVIKRMSEIKIPIDELSLSEKLDEIGKLDSVGGFYYISDLSKKFVSKAMLSIHVKSLRELKIKRDLVSLSKSLNDMVMSKEKNQDIINKMEESLRDISLLTGGTELQHIKEACSGWFDELEKRVQSGGGVTGLRTGFDLLDERLGGIGDESLITVVGRPSHGKTLWTQAISQNVGVNQNKGVMFFSMEMASHELYERFISGVSNANYSKIRTGMIDKETEARISSGVNLIDNSNIYFTADPTQSLGQIRAKARKHKTKHPDLSMIVIDYLGMMELEKSDRHDIAIGKVTRGLKQLAKEIKVPIFLIAQANRNVDKGVRPTMSDIKDSSSIEADSDVVIFVNRPEVADPETELKGVTEIIVAKDRHNGGNGTIYMEKVNGQFVELNNERMGFLQAREDERVNPPKRKKGMQHV